MTRKFINYPVNNFTEVKTKMLNWTTQFNIFCLLDNHQYSFSTPEFECLLAAGSLETLSASAGKSFDSLQHFTDSNPDWIFGHLSYDLKNEIEDLASDNFDGINFPDIFFFVPKVVLILKKNFLSIGCVTNDHEKIFQAINSAGYSEFSTPAVKPLKARFSKTEYIEAVNQLQYHIHRGDCYEINFCQEFYSDDLAIEPMEAYLKLSALSPNPFAAFYKLNDKYLLCSSPERYLKKDGDRIFTQPIKGTAKRNQIQAEDEKNKKDLLTSKKETSENVMVVDLVRNDLSKVCKERSVNVDELFGLYSFPQVHQMISTVSGIVEDGKTISDILKATFPMGSMTGVPKKKVMELIEKYERTKRGLFSGAVGYITPDGDFNFNVVIRSILYNATNKYVSIQAGSAITFYSDPEKEYEECLLKVEALKKVLE